MNARRWIGLVVVALAVAFGVFWIIRRSGHAADATSEKEEAGPVARVKVVPLRRDRIEETIDAYGTVVAAPGEAETFSVPFECRVRAVFVAAGAVIESNSPLLEIEPSPDTQLQYDQAASERDSAARAMDLLKQRLELKLATRQDLLQAQQRLHDAELHIQSMKTRGIEGARAIRADAAGVVSQISVQPGQIIAAGTALVETIGQNQLVAHLGLEEKNVARLQLGQVVHLAPVNSSGDHVVEGHIRTITHQVNPQTRLVDVFVSPAPDSVLMLNEYVEARLAIASRDALVVPRAAALPETDHYVLYTVEKDRAVKHAISIGLQNTEEIEAIGEGLQDGQSVVVVGNSELEDGMKVETGTVP